VPDVLIDTIRTIDDIFIRLAENQPLRQWGADARAAR
jgi:hypothetical protein